MESQREVWNDYLRLRDQSQALMPDLVGVKNALTGEAYKEGVLSTKVKRLMGLAVGLRAGCKFCIVGQTMLALQAGATREEIFETLAVATAMGGTPGLSESFRVLQLLDELGKL